MRKALNFITVSHVDTVLAAALDFSSCQTPREQLQEPLGELKVSVAPETKKKTGTIRQ